MGVYAPDSGKDLEYHQQFVEDMTKIPRDGRREGRNVSTAQAILTLSYEDEELFDMYGPQCWQRCDADPRGFSEVDVV